MRHFKKIVLSLMIIVCLSTSVTGIASAKTVYSGFSMICTSAGDGYRNFNNKKMIGQACVEKYVKVGKNKTLKVYPYTTKNTNNNNGVKNYVGVKDYVQFTVWVYDVNTGKRVDTEICSNGGYTTWKNDIGKTVHLSVQVRPYIAQSAWKKYNYNSINAYIKSSQFRFKCTY